MGMRGGITGLLQAAAGAADVPPNIPALCAAPSLTLPPSLLQLFPLRVRAGAAGGG